MFYIIKKNTHQGETGSDCCRSKTLSWAENHFCIDSPSPSDLRAALRTKADGELDSSWLSELWLSDPASGDTGDIGDGELVDFITFSAPSPFITGKDSL